MLRRTPQRQAPSGRAYVPTEAGDPDNAFGRVGRIAVVPYPSLSGSWPGSSKRGRTVAGRFAIGEVGHPSVGHGPFHGAEPEGARGAVSPGRAVHPLVAVEDDGRLHLLPRRGVERRPSRSSPTQSTKSNVCGTLIRVQVSPGVHRRFAASPGHLRAPQQRPLPAVVVAGSGCRRRRSPGPAAVPRPPRATSPARATPSVRRRVPPGRRAARRSTAGGDRQVDGHLQQPEALAEVDLHPSRWIRGSSRCRVSVHRTAEWPSQPSERTRARSGPLSSTTHPRSARSASTGSSNRSVWKVQVSVLSRRRCRPMPPSPSRSCRRTSSAGSRARPAPRADDRSRWLGRDLQVRVRGARRRDARRFGPAPGRACWPSRPGGRRTRSTWAAASGCTTWNVYGPSLEVAQPALTPGVEAQERLRLDQALPALVVGVEDHDLLLVGRRQRAARPAPGGLHGDLLAGDPGAPLHRPHGVPRRGDRGAGEDVVERREQQIVPGARRAGRGAPAAPRRLRRSRRRYARPGPAGARRAAAAA